MKEDAVKIFFERGKTESKWVKNKPYPKDRKKFRELPSKERMRDHLTHHWWSKYDSKTYFKHLTGFLNKNIGNSWDDVYSEFRKTVNAKTYQGTVFLDALKNLIQFDCELNKEDGMIYPLKNHYRKHPIKPLVTSDSRHLTYYIHPESKTLEIAPFKVFNSHTKEHELIVFPNNKWLQYRKITKSIWKDSIRGYVKKTDWYAFTLSKKPEMVQRTINQFSYDLNGVRYVSKQTIVWEYPNNEKDVLLNVSLENIHDSRLKYLYKDSSLYASKKKLLNSRELKIVRKTLESVG